MLLRHRTCFASFGFATVCALGLLPSAALAISHPSGSSHEHPSPTATRVNRLGAGARRLPRFRALARLRPRALRATRPARMPLARLRTDGRAPLEAQGALRDLYESDPDLAHAVADEIQGARLHVEYGGLSPAGQEAAQRLSVAFSGDQEGGISVWFTRMLDGMSRGDGDTSAWRPVNEEAGQHAYGTGLPMDKLTERVQADLAIVRADVDRGVRIVAAPGQDAPSETLQRALGVLNRAARTNSRLARARLRYARANFMDGRDPDDLRFRRIAMGIAAGAAGVGFGLEQVGLGMVATPMVLVADDGSNTGLETGSRIGKIRRSHLSASEKRQEIRRTLVAKLVPSLGVLAVSVPAGMYAAEHMNASGDVVGAGAIFGAATTVPAAFASGLELRGTVRAEREAEQSGAYGERTGGAGKRLGRVLRATVRELPQRVSIIAASAGATVGLAALNHATHGAAVGMIPTQALFGGTDTIINLATHSIARAVFKIEYRVGLLSMKLRDSFSARRLPR